jgi:hypothetical protein
MNGGGKDREEEIARAADHRDGQEERRTTPQA